MRNTMEKVSSGEGQQENKPKKQNKDTRQLCLLSLPRRAGHCPSLLAQLLSHLPAALRNMTPCKNSGSVDARPVDPASEAAGKGEGECATWGGRG